MHELTERARERFARLTVAFLPVLLALPQLAGVLNVDPLVGTGLISAPLERGILGGVPFIDPNSGFQTQALGHRSAVDWLAGRVPWWNYYSGIGLPLAAEYQPASFFPFTLLLLLPLGAVYLHVLLQCACGLGTYLVLRRLDLGRRAAVAGGLLFAFNGTLAWFAHAPASVVPTLPWILYGIERARHAALAGVPAGWRTIAVAMALSLLAGFPETAYIDGLFCLMWACVRTPSPRSGSLIPFAARVVAGGAVALLVSAPQLLAFVQYLPLANVGAHSDMSHSALPPLSAIGSLVAPYVFGPIFAYQDSFPFLRDYWGSIGGYVTIALVATAAYGFWLRRNALAVALVAWIVLTLGKTFLVEPAVTIWNLVPGIDVSAFARYAQPTWEFALVVLATFALDRVPTMRATPALALAALLGLAAVAWASITLVMHRHELASSRGLGNSAIASMAWAALTLATAITLLWRAPRTGALGKLGVLLVLESMLMAFIPALSAPKRGNVDWTAVQFLRSNLGLQRFFTLGPIAPNYGAYFGIASINHNYLPVSRRWVDELKARFGQQDPVVFNGDGPAALAAAREGIAELERLAVRFVVTPPGLDPYAERSDVKRVYADATLAIFELPAPAPYFESVPSACRLSIRDRDRVTADCPASAVLVRRELFFPGWEASAGPDRLAVRAYHDLFQSVDLPPGHSEVRFRYSPPYIDWAWGAMLVGVALIVASTAAQASRLHRARG